MRRKMLRPFSAKFCILLPGFYYESCLLITSKDTLQNLEVKCIKIHEYKNKGWGSSSLWDPDQDCVKKKVGPILGRATPFYT